MSLPTSQRFVTQLINSLPSNVDDKNLEPDINTGVNANPLSAVSESTKKQLLSLQVLFPNEFLPGLDLLDRGLVTRLRVGNGEDKISMDMGTDAKSGGQAQAHAKDTVMEQPHDERMLDQTHGYTTNTAISHPVTEPHHRNTSASPISSLDQPPPDNTSHPSSHNAIYYVRSAQQRTSRYSTSYDTITSYEVRLLAWNCSCPAFTFAAFPAVHPEPPIPAYPSDIKDKATMERNKGDTWIFGGVSLGDAIPPVCKHLLACVLVEKCSGLFGGFVEERDVSVEEAAGWAAGWGD